jgi:predicted HNH restriction endonuclease
MRFTQDYQLEQAMTYQDYISSARWRFSTARLAELEASGFRCRLCDEPATDDLQLEVHHRTYVRLFSELMRDLTALCSKCHFGVTDMHRRSKYSLRTPTASDLIPSITRPLALFDPSMAGARS